MVTDNKDLNEAIPRKSIRRGDRVPEAAIFIKRTAIEFLQVLFSTRSSGNFKWDSDSTISEIQISDQYAVNLTDVNKRPMIIAIRGPISGQNFGLGGNNIESIHLPTNTTVLNNILNGSVALNCISREGIEAERLAQLVFNSFRYFSLELRKYGFFTINSINIGAESLIESSGSEEETTLVPVYINASVQERYALEETASRKLRQIVIEFLTDE